MADYGLQVNNNWGGFLVDGDFPNFSLARAERFTIPPRTAWSQDGPQLPGRVTLSATMRNLITANPDCIMATSCAEHHSTFNGVIVSNTDHTVAAAGVAYLFNRVQNLRYTGGYGLQVNNASGAEIFNSRAAYPSILYANSLVFTKSSAVNFAVPSGRKVAVALTGGSIICESSRYYDNYFGVASGLSSSTNVNISMVHEQRDAYEDVGGFPSATMPATSNILIFDVTDLERFAV